MKKNTKIIRYQVISAAFVALALIFNSPKSFIGVIFVFLVHLFSIVLGSIFYKEFVKTVNLKTIFLSSFVIFLTMYIFSFCLKLHKGLYFIFFSPDKDTLYFSGFVLLATTLGAALHYYDYFEDVDFEA